MSLFWVCLVIGLVPFVLYFRWFIIQLAIVIAVVFSNISYGWAGDNPGSPYAALWCGIFAALLFTAATNMAVRLWQRLASHPPQPLEEHQTRSVAASTPAWENKDTLAEIQALLQEAKR